MPATQQAAEDRLHSRHRHVAGLRAPTATNTASVSTTTVSSRVTVLQGRPEPAPRGAERRRTCKTVVKDLDLVIHCAGLVEFVPPLDKALDSQRPRDPELPGPGPPCGPRPRRASCTCRPASCAGARPGVSTSRCLDPHDYPKRTHSAASKASTPHKELVRSRKGWSTRVRNLEAEDPAVQADLWEQAGGQQAPGQAASRTLHVRRRLVEIGIERSQRWGWPNTYTYSKALAERLVHAAARRPRPGDHRAPLGRRELAQRTRSRGGTRGSTPARRWCG